MLIGHISLVPSLDQPKFSCIPDRQKTTIFSFRFFSANFMGRHIERFMLPNSFPLRLSTAAELSEEGCSSRWLVDLFGKVV